jgi:hypothetical protein
MVLCRTLTVAQCFNLDLAVTFIATKGRSQIFVFVGEGIARFDAVPFGWRFLFAKRTEGFATSLLFLNAIFVCLERRSKLGVSSNQASDHRERVAKDALTVMSTVGQTQH